MEGGIFLLRPDESLLRMNEQPYEAEDLLQKLLADHSDLLAGDQINMDEPRRWLFIGREVGVPSEEGGSGWWSLDHLFIDQDSIPTFVEVKRSSDNRARREVVAQMLDYAANATTYWPASRMRELHARHCELLGVEPEADLRSQVGEKVDIEGFWALADQNLRLGRVRLLFVSDRIPSELRRIVEFLNLQMNPAEVLALEVKQYVGASDGSPVRTLVPRVIGQTEVAKSQKHQSAPRSALPIVSQQKFVSLLAPELREATEWLIETAGRIGFEIKPWSSANQHQIRFLVPGVAGVPIYIYEEGTIWFSLGRSHAPLRQEETNRKLRGLLTQACPARRRDIEQKTEVGLRLGQMLDQEPLRTLGEALVVTYRSLNDSATGSAK